MVVNGALAGAGDDTGDGVVAGRGVGRGVPVSPVVVPRAAIIFICELFNILTCTFKNQFFIQ